jgi:hypothetical protein
LATGPETGVPTAAPDELVTLNVTEPSLTVPAAEVTVADTLTDWVVVDVGADTVVAVDAGATVRVVVADLAAKLPRVSLYEAATVYDPAGVPAGRL